jgi:hypothetical protein
VGKGRFVAFVFEGGFDEDSVQVTVGGITKLDLELNSNESTSYATTKYVKVAFGQRILFWLNGEMKEWRLYRGHNYIYINNTVGFQIEFSNKERGYL